MHFSDFTDTGFYIMAQVGSGVLYFVFFYQSSPVSNRVQSDSCRRQTLQKKSLSIILKLKGQLQNTYCYDCIHYFLHTDLINHCRDHLFNTPGSVRSNIFFSFDKQKRFLQPIYTCQEVRRAIKCAYPVAAAPQPM